ncbi:MAG: c-type cytochrome domain-containing protein [Bacteroidota bacterium]
MAVLLVNIPELIGRFHPVLVHLPIGILLLAALFQLLSQKEKFQSLHAATGIALFWGMLFAIASCISGYLLSTTGDYDEALIFKHQWLGIAVAVVSIIANYLHRKKNRQNKWVIMLMILLIIITGHFGGSITHGSDYLTSAFSADSKEISFDKRKPIPDVQQAFAYSDVIRPILESRCYGCHGPNKQKGKLRLDQPEFILKGGKDGEVIIAGKTDESALIKRIFLPKESKDLMPPKEKPQLSKQELELLHWWVSSGADFTKKINQLSQTEKIKPVLLALQSEEMPKEITISEIPEKAVGKADPVLVQKLRERGVAIFPVAQNSNYLSANFVAVDSITGNDLQLLEPLRKQLISLKLGNSKITDTNLVVIAKLSSLTRLSLERTPVTDKGIVQLKSLSQLQYLNLVGTKVTAKGLEQLKELKNLQQVFLYQTSIARSEWVTLEKYFPQLKLIQVGIKFRRWQVIR